MINNNILLMYDLCIKWNKLSNWNNMEEQIQFQLSALYVYKNVESLYNKNKIELYDFRFP